MRPRSDDSFNEWKKRSVFSSKRSDAEYAEESAENKSEGSLRRENGKDIYRAHIAPIRELRPGSKETLRMKDSGVDRKRDLGDAWQGVATEFRDLSLPQ